MKKLILTITLPLLLLFTVIPLSAGPLQFLQCDGQTGQMNGLCQAYCGPLSCDFVVNNDGICVEVGDPFCNPCENLFSKIEQAAGEILGIACPSGGF